MALQIFGSAAGAGGGGAGGASATVVTSTAYAATVTPAVGTVGAPQILNVGTLTGNITLANPTGTPTDGQKLTIRLAQDATGGRTFTFGTGYAFGTDLPASAMPAIASAKCELLLSWHAGDAKWRAIGLARGF